MSKIVVNYFQIRGRGEPIRLVLKAAGVDFEDHRISFAEWPTEKLKTPTGVLPFVKMPDGKILTESLAIARYFALEHGFMGNSNLDVYLIERALGTYTDLMDAALQVNFASEAEKPKKKEEFISGKGKSCLKQLSGFIKEKGKFFVDKPSLADFCIMSMWVTLKKNFGELTKDFPEFDVHHENVCKDLPKVAAYIASRPDTPI